jgi:hypothetical protein
LKIQLGKGSLGKVASKMIKKSCALLP